MPHFSDLLTKIYPHLEWVNVDIKAGFKTNVLEGLFSMSMLLKSPSASFVDICS